MDVPIYQDILSILRFLVVEHIPKGAFRTIGPRPDWYLKIKPDQSKREKAFHPAANFPFLDSFLPQAEAFWADVCDGHLRSGHWIETDPQGTEYLLEAVAISGHGKQLLVIGSAWDAMGLRIASPSKTAARCEAIFAGRCMFLSLLGACSEDFP